MADGTLKAGVMGWPVSHSLSPKLHNYWLTQLGIKGEYVALAVEPSQLAGAITSLPSLGFRGCNLTLPHKEAVMDLLDEIDSTARIIGAVNTVIVRDGKLTGTNTDAYGFIENIRPHLPARKDKAVILGAGGAARSVCKALLDEGFKSILITNRGEARAQMLANHFGKTFTAAPWQQRSTILDGADLLVNTTSLGLNEKEPLEIDLSALPVHALVTDIVYVPLLTPLLEIAKKRGNPIVDGLGMLIHQGVPGFEAWFGVRPPVTDELKRYLLA